MIKRKIGEFTVSAVGLGCMNLSHGYGPPVDHDHAVRLLNRALDLGCDHLDTAALYGYGSNEELLRAAVMGRRGEFMLASKCGIVRREDGSRVLDGTPRAIRRVCEESLSRLGTEVIDLYYLHRKDRKVPIEESVGALGELVREGKIRSVGLSEISADTLRRAAREFPIAAVQNEYSLWTRNPEIGLIEACREVGATLVAFSPLARAFLTGKLTDPSTLPQGDMRLGMPRFTSENYPKNLRLYADFADVARQAGCTPAQLALAWVLAQGDHVVAIPGTTSIEHLEENMGGMIEPDARYIAMAGEIINQNTVIGRRYSEAMQADVDTEDFEPA